MDIRQTPAYEHLIRAHHLLERAQIGLTLPNSGIRHTFEAIASQEGKTVDEVIAADINRAMTLIAKRIPCDWCGDPQMECECEATD